MQYGNFMLIRFFDILFSLLAIIALFPFMLIVMIVLKLTGEHCVFYKQPRVGRDGKIFYVLKFVTMLKNSENMPGGVLTQKNDPRVLPFGKFLRKTKINELPQLINILVGEMSIIGPRPQAKRHYDLYAQHVKDAINQIPPGLSGIGSVVFRNEEGLLDNVGGDRDAFHDTVIAPYKGELEVWFSQHRNLKNYFKLIWLTVKVVINDKNSGWYTAFKDLPVIPPNLAGLI